MHRRISIHQAAFIREGESLVPFIEHCRAIGVFHMTLTTPSLMEPGAIEEAERTLAAGGPRVECLVHPFAFSPNLERDTGQATERLIHAIDIAVILNAKSIYIATGGRGSLSWEDAAQRFSHLIAPCRRVAHERGIKLLIETVSDFNVDIHIAHTLADTIILAELANIGVCIDLHPCWFESGLRPKLRQALPITGLVQVSDYVLGDKTAPCRAVPGDGVIPLERILGDLLDDGYEGVFDLELVGPRIQAEGARAATARAAQNLSEILITLGA
jgi:sugar phosphate isomerase/epimerase